MISALVTDSDKNNLTDNMIKMHKKKSEINNWKPTDHQLENCKKT